LTTRLQTNGACFLPTPIPCIPLPIMNKMLFYAPNYCSTSNQFQSSNPHALMMGFLPLRGGQAISANGIFPTRSQFSVDGISSTQRTVFVHSADGISPTRKCQSRRDYRRSLGYPTEVETLCCGIFLTQSPQLCCRNFSLSEPPLGFFSLGTQAIAYELLSSEPMGR